MAEVCTLPNALQFAVIAVQFISVQSRRYEQAFTDLLSVLTGPDPEAYKILAARVLNCSSPYENLIKVFKKISIRSAAKTKLAGDSPQASLESLQCPQMP